MRGFVVALVIVVAVFSAYAGVRHNGFVNYDDHAYIVENERVQQGLTSDNIRWAFTTFDTGNWHPLTWLSLMLDWQLFPDQPATHHFINVGLHAINTLLLLAALSMMTGSFWPSAATAFLWSVHPLRVESVAWASERKDVLAAMFGLACLVAYARYVRAPSISRYVPIAASLAIGLLCKPMLVTWPCLLLLLDFWPLRRVQPWCDDENYERATFPLAKLVLEKLPLIVIVAASCVVTVIAQKSVNAVGSTDIYPLATRMSNSIVAVMRYLQTLFWPTNLAALYPYELSLPAQLVATASIVISLLSIVAILCRRGWPWLLVGWLWFLGTLIPVIGLVQVGVQARADRYTYVPQIGLVMAVVFTLWALVRKRDAATMIAAAAIAVPLWLQTRHQVGFWRDSQSLYQRALDVTSNNWIMLNNMGNLLLQRERIAEAEPYFAEAARVAPLEPAPAEGLANVVYQQGRTAQAIPLYERALALKQDNYNVLNNLAWLLATQPPPLRDGPRAVGLAARACTLVGAGSADFPAFLDTYAAALAAAGRFDEAVQSATRAIQQANMAGNKDLAQQIQGRLQRYRNRNTAE